MLEKFGTIKEGKMLSEVTNSLTKKPNTLWFIVLGGVFIIMIPITFYAGIKVGKAKTPSLDSTQQTPSDKRYSQPQQSESTKKDNSLSSLDNTKKVIGQIKGNTLTFQLDGSSTVHNLTLPSDIDYKEILTKLPTGTDYIVSFENGMRLDILRAPSVVHYANFAYDYTEANLWSYSQERIPVIITTKIDGATIYTETSNNQYPGEWESFRYYGFKLLPQSGTQQNIVVAVSAPLSVSGIKPVIERTIESAN